MDVEETSGVKGRTSDEADIKQELLDSEPTDSSTDIKDELITKIGEEKSQTMEVPTVPKTFFFNTAEETSPLLISSVIKQEAKLPADLELIKRDVESWQETGPERIKQEPLDADQTDPDDFTTQLITEGSEHEMEDIKYVNTQDYLDIGETMICEQDRAISEQDRPIPGTSSNGDVRCQKNIPKNNDTTLLTSHMQFECAASDYKSKRLGDLDKHLRTHTGKKLYKCEICEYQSRRLNNLKKHSRTHTGEEPYKCEICEYQFKTLIGLKSHMKTHPGEKPYKCEICDYQCILRGYLKIHMRMHTGRNLYKCEICYYQYKQRSSLKRHIMAVHTKGKPYKCEICNIRCKNLGNLKKHNIIVHTEIKPYKCEVCNYRSKTRYDLKCHMITHTGEKQFKCETCKYQSRLFSHFRSHICFTPIDHLFR